MLKIEYILFILAWEKEVNYLVSPSDPISRHTFSKLINRSTIKIEDDIRYPEEKYLGVDIDIFPIDRLLQNPRILVVMNKKVRKEQRTLRVFYS